MVRQFSIKFGDGPAERMPADRDGENLPGPLAPVPGLLQRGGPMGFKAGVSGNPAGRPKKLLRRVDEVLHERGIEPIAKVLSLLDQLAKLKPVIGPSPKHLKGTAAKQSWRAARRAEHVEARLKQSLEIWLEVLPYVYAQPKELSGQLDLRMLEPFVIHRPGGEVVEIGAKEPDDQAV